MNSTNSIELNDFENIEMKIFLSFLFLSQCYGDAFATNENRDDNEHGKKGRLSDINFDFTFSIFITLQKK